MSEISEKQIQLCHQCMQVARLAQEIANVHWELAVLHRSVPEKEGFVDYVGKLSHERMEALGNMLNGMDAVDPELSRISKSVFEGARKYFPIESSHD